MAEYVVLAAPTKNDLKAVLGDAASSTFVPRLKLSKWDGEVEFSVAHDFTGMSGTRTFSQTAGKYTLDNSRIALNFYAKTEGYEFELILKRKPATNTISLPITTKGLALYYQPPLTDEWTVGQKTPWGTTIASVTATDAIDSEGRIVFHRPEDVVGSYAVYHATKRDDYTALGGMNYGCGKAFHIFRPLLTDAKGATSWATLKVDESAGRLIITADQTFLNTATYPVIVDPTFGTSGFGAGAVLIPGGYLCGTKYACSEAGTITSLSAYVSQSGGASNVQMAVYTTAATPARVGYTGSVAIDVAAAWKTANAVVGGTLSATNFWLCINDSGGEFNWYADSATGGALNYEESAFGSWPATLTGWTDYVDYKMSIYCTYTTGGTAYTLACDGASYAWTGQAVGTLRAAKIDAAAASYALTGQAAGAYYGRKVAAEAASYALTGADVGLRRTALLAAEAAAYDLTGGAVGLLRAAKLDATGAAYEWTGADVTALCKRLMSAAAAEYALTGADAGLRRNALISAEAGVYTLTVEDVAFLRGYGIVAEAGEYTLTAQAATLLRAAKIAAEGGAYELTGADTALLRAALIAADGTSYAWTVADVTLLKTTAGAYVLTAEGAVYALTGQAVGLLKTSRIAAEGASYVVTGQDAATLVDRVLVAGAAAYEVTGQAASLIRAAKLVAETGAYGLTFADANLIAAVLNTYTLTADPAVYAWTGQSVGLAYKPLEVDVATRHRNRYAGQRSKYAGLRSPYIGLRNQRSE